MMHERDGDDREARGWASQYECQQCEGARVFVAAGRIIVKHAPGCPAERLVTAMKSRSPGGGG